MLWMVEGMEGESLELALDFLRPLPRNARFILLAVV